VVNFKDSGNRSRRFFETKREAETFVQQKTIELQNPGREGAEFPSSLRITASECSQLLNAARKDDPGGHRSFPHVPASLGEELHGIRSRCGVAGREARGRCEPPLASTI